MKSLPQRRPSARPFSSFALLIALAGTIGIGCLPGLVPAGRAQPPAIEPAAEGLAVDLVPDPFTPSVKVLVKNLTRRPLTSHVSLSNPDEFLGTTGRVVQIVDLPARASVLVKFELPGAAMAPDSRYAFTADVQTETGLHVTTTRMLSFFQIERAVVPPAMDGSMQNWLNASMIIVNIPGRPAGGEGWKGQADMTATARFLWDTDNLYAMFRRTDDHLVLVTEPNDKRGDRMRLAVSPSGSHLLNAPTLSLDFIPLASGELAVLRSRSSFPSLKTGLLPDVQASVTNQNGVMVFVVAIPWKELGVGTGIKTKRLGLTVRSIDDDGNGPKSWLEWGGGAGMVPDPPSFSDVSLGD